MTGSSKLFILIPTILLVPMLLGMTPLNCIYNIGIGCPLGQAKKILRCNPCPFHLLISQNDPNLLSLNSMPLEQGSIPSFISHALTSHSVLLITSLSITHLRC